MTFADVEELIAHVQMLPGWQMTAELGNHEGPWLRVYDPDVANSYGGPPTVLDIHISIRDILAIRRLTSDQFYDWLHSRLERLAVHEHHEFFRIDGKAWVDPHAEGYGLESWGPDHAHDHQGSTTMSNQQQNQQQNQQPEQDPQPEQNPQPQQQPDAQPEPAPVDDPTQEQQDTEG